MVLVRTAQALFTGAKVAAANPTVRKVVAAAVAQGASVAVRRAPEVYRARSPIIAVTGLTGTGKSVLVHQLCSPANKWDYEPMSYQSVNVEKAWRRDGLHGLRFRTVPGGSVATRSPGLIRLFHDEPVDGVVHVVADGLATARFDGSDPAPEQLSIDAYRALQREREVEDFRATAVHIAALVAASTRPIWLLIAVTKTDLLHPDIAADVTRNYYSVGGHSDFAAELRTLRRRVGEGHLTIATMPVYAMARDFEFNGTVIPTRGNAQDRDARLAQFLHRLQHLTDQVA